MASLDKLISAVTSSTKYARRWAEATGGADGYEKYELSLRKLSTALADVMPELKRRVSRAVASVAGSGQTSAVGTVQYDLGSAVMQIGFYADQRDQLTEYYSSYVQHGLLDDFEAFQDLSDLAHVEDDTDDTAIYTYIYHQLVKLLTGAAHAKKGVSDPASDVNTVMNTVKPLFRILLNITTIMKQREFDDEY